MLSFLELFLLLREDLPVLTSAPTQVTLSLRSFPSSSSPSLDSPGSSRITPLPCDLALLERSSPSFSMWETSFFAPTKLKTRLFCSDLEAFQASLYDELPLSGTSTLSSFLLITTGGIT